MTSLASDKQPPVEGREFVSTSTGDESLLQFARSANEAATSWFDSSVRRELEDAYARFYNQHPQGSKYHHEEYAKRSKIFRPKTRTAIRTNEAAAVMAAFSTKDVVHCAPANDRDPAQVKAAELHKALVNYRLEHSIPWYKIYVGGVQEAQTAGVVISKQTWEYKERTVREKVTMRDIHTNELFDQYTERVEVTKDHPTIRLCNPENVKFDPGCDWCDPVGSSPYIIHTFPMYALHIKARSKDDYPGRVKFREVDDSILMAASQNDWDSVRRARETGRADKYDSDIGIFDYQMCWVNEYIVEREDGDWVFYTLGDNILLSDEVPLEEVYEHGRPYAFGSALIEAHKNYPGGLPKLAEGLQDLANDVANLRIDNVKLSMVGRYFARRGRGIDLRALIRNTPGSVVTMTDPNNDLKWDRPQDVTRSSYEEQDRINMDMDDLTGNMNHATVGANRKLNETVGGLELMNSGKDMVQEYLLRTIVETWVEPALKQIVKLEAIHESDQNVMLIAANKADTDIDTAFRLLPIEANLTVNIGFGATSPDKRIGRLAMGLNAVANYSPQLAMEADGVEIASEVFGALGMDAGRFFPSARKGEKQEDPQVAQLKQQIQELQQAIQLKQVESQTKLQIEQMRQQTALIREQISARFKAAELRLKEQVNIVDSRLKTEQSDIARRQLLLQREALNKAIVDTEREYQLQLWQMGALPAPPGLDQPVPVQQVRGNMPSGPIDITPGAVNLPGDDVAGIISRDRYGDIPMAAQ